VDGSGWKMRQDSAFGVSIRQGGADQRHKLIRLEGFAQEGVGARLKEIPAFLFSAKAEDEGMGAMGAQQAGNVRSVHAGHAVVGNNDAITFSPNGVQGGFSVDAAADLEPVSPEQGAERVADHGIVIDYQDLFSYRHIRPRG
jgi:hypothetical protein